MANRSVHASIYGRVQGVFFRDYTCRKAEELGLTGWVRNCRDGSVQCLISGDDGAVESMIDWLHRGSPSARVERVVIGKTPRDQNLSGFRVVY
ncbi:MAG: acylphosphatase [Desulfofustis sp.]|nr:acylphosphatase [Desulfofustis sp.]